MDRASLAELLTPQGRAALATAMELAPDEATFLICHNRLTRHHSPTLARAAVETALLRRRAASKFHLASRMYFTREALEQASSEVVARHRARRFAGQGVVADLCCGIGGDAIALADLGAVVAVDRDPLRLDLAGLNLEAHDQRDRATLLEGDVLEVELPPVDGAFVDPDRRLEGRRVLSIRACQPPLPEVLARLPRDLPRACKLAPAVAWSELNELDGEAEFVSLAGELKECVLWQGPLRTSRRRATVLPAQATLAAEEPSPWPAAGEPGDFLYDPDPAIVRAGLVGDLAAMLDAWPLDPGIAYLSARVRQDTVFARTYAIDSAMPFHLGRLRRHLRDQRIGRVQVMRRGSPIDPVDLERRLKLSGEEFRLLVLTQVEGRPWVLIVRHVESQDG